MEHCIYSRDYVKLKKLIKRNPGKFPLTRILNLLGKYGVSEGPVDHYMLEIVEKLIPYLHIDIKIITRNYLDGFKHRWVAVYNPIRFAAIKYTLRSMSKDKLTSYAMWLSGYNLDDYELLCYIVHEYPGIDIYRRPGYIDSIIKNVCVYGRLDTIKKLISLSGFPGPSGGAGGIEIDEYLIHYWLEGPRPEYEKIDGVIYLFSLGASVIKAAYNIMCDLVKNKLGFNYKARTSENRKLLFRYHLLCCLDPSIVSVKAINDASLKLKSHLRDRKLRHYHESFIFELNILDIIRNTYNPVPLEYIITKRILLAGGDYSIVKVPQVLLDEFGI